jgi:hypothetical protein
MQDNTEAAPKDGPDAESIGEMKAARLDYGKALTAEFLSEVAQSIGTERALALARRFGGRRLYIPRRVPVDHPISRCIGINAAEHLAATLGGEAFTIPGASGYLRWLDARALRIIGLSHPAIGRILGVQDRHVRRLLRGFRPELYQIDDTVRAIARLYHVPIERPSPIRRQHMPRQIQRPANEDAERADRAAADLA